MPVRVSCPHCRTPCLVAEHHLGVPLKCGRCGRTFTTRAEPSAPATAPASPSAAPSVRLDIGAVTSPGRVRDRNEDSFLVQHLVCSNLEERHEIAVLAVADGVGGAPAGDRASGLVIRTAGAALAPLLSKILSGTSKDIGAAESIAAALREANRAVWNAAQKDADGKGMGATAAIVVVCGGQVHIGHVGDCRVYHQRADQLAQVTRDEATNAIGKAAQIDPAAYQRKLSAGDWLVVACAGLHAHVDTSILQEEIAKATSCAIELAQQLVERAGQLGGSDNCTVVAVRCY